MIKNYLRTALRFLAKNKVFSFINIFGLTMGTLCCLYIVLYVTDQYSYDKQHAHVKDIYRIDNIVTSTSKGINFNAATVVAPVVPLRSQAAGSTQPAAVLSRPTVARPMVLAAQ